MDFYSLGGEYPKLVKPSQYDSIYISDVLDNESEKNGSVRYLINFAKLDRVVREGGESTTMLPLFSAVYKSKEERDKQYKEITEILVNGK